MGAGSSKGSQSVALEDRSLAEAERSNLELQDLLANLLVEEERCVVDTHLAVAPLASRLQELRQSHANTSSKARELEACVTDMQAEITSLRDKLCEAQTKLDNKYENLFSVLRSDDAPAASYAVPRAEKPVSARVPLQVVMPPGVAPVSVGSPLPGRNFTHSPQTLHRSFMLPRQAPHVSAVLTPPMGGAAMPRASVVPRSIPALGWTGGPDPILKATAFAAQSADYARRMTLPPSFGPVPLRMQACG